MDVTRKIAGMDVFPDAEAASRGDCAVLGLCQASAVPGIASQCNKIQSCTASDTLTASSKPSEAALVEASMSSSRCIIHGSCLRML